MQCIRCGKEIEVTTGGNYHCPSCNMAVNDLVYRPSEWKPFPSFVKQEGWICPVCGRGVAPFVDVCPCRQGAGVINVTTTTNPEDISVDLTKYYTLINDGTVPEAKL